MKQLFSSKKTAVILVIVAVVYLCLYGYVLTRPITYGLPYSHTSMYDDEMFEAVMVFYEDNTMVTRSSNFDGEFQSWYYYKDGFVFFTMAQSEAEYLDEVAMIEANFDEAVSTPFYAAKTSVLRADALGMDDFATTYLCTYAMNCAGFFGAIGAILVILACLSCARCKKAKKKNKSLKNH